MRTELTMEELEAVNGGFFLGKLWDFAVNATEFIIDETTKIVKDIKDRITGEPEDTTPMNTVTIIK